MGGMGYTGFLQFRALGSEFVASTDNMSVCLCVM